MNLKRWACVEWVRCKGAFQLQNAPFSSLDSLFIVSKDIKYEAQLLTVGVTAFFFKCLCPRGLPCGYSSACPPSTPPCSTGEEDASRDLNGRRIWWEAFSRSKMQNPRKWDFGDCGTGASFNSAGIFSKAFSSLRVNVSHTPFRCQSSTPLSSVSHLPDCQSWWKSLMPSVCLCRICRSWSSLVEVWKWASENDLSFILSPEMNKLAYPWQLSCDENWIELDVLWWITMPTIYRSLS